MLYSIYVFRTAVFRLQLPSGKYVGVEMCPKSAADCKNTLCNQAETVARIGMCILWYVKYSQYGILLCFTGHNIVCDGDVGDYSNGLPQPATNIAIY